MRTLLAAALSLCALSAYGADVKIDLPGGGTTKTTVLRVGDTVTFSLDANATTGYQWTAKASKNLKALKSAYTPSKSHLTGAGGRQTFQFKAVATGKASATFVYARPWEKKAKPAKVVSLELSIKA